MSLVETQNCKATRKSQPALLFHGKDALKNALSGRPPRGCGRAAEGAHGPPPPGPLGSDLPNCPTGRAGLAGGLPAPRAGRSSCSGADPGRGLRASLTPRGVPLHQRAPRSHDLLQETRARGQLGLDLAPPGTAATAEGQAPTGNCNPREVFLPRAAQLSDYRSPLPRPPLPLHTCAEKS